MDLQKIQILDNNLLKLAESFHSDKLTQILRPITELGGTKMVIAATFILALIVCAIYIKKGKDAQTDEEEKQYKSFGILNALFIVGTVGGIGVVNQVVKRIIKRPRPNAFPQLLTDDGYSCPSAHSMVFSALIVVMVYYVSNLEINSILKVILEIILIALSILVALTRVYFGVHYLSDIAIGLFAGYALSLISIAIFNAIRKRF